MSLILRILLIHNYYGSAAPSGENFVVEAERNLLQSRGHNVLLFSKHSDDLRNAGVVGLLKGAMSVAWSSGAGREVERTLAEFKPDLVHAHNTFPMISPSIFYKIKQVCPSVLTLHNYRLQCPAAIPLRDSRVCTECIDQRSTAPSLKYGCYRNSRIATLPVAASVSLHNRIGTWRQYVDSFIVLSEFQKRMMISGGLPSNKVYVKPNFYEGSPKVVSMAERGGYVLYAGRLSAEKGVQTLIEAWRNWGESAPELRIVGDGPLRESLASKAKNLNVKFMGQRTHKETQLHISKASMVVLPSEWFEGFPMIVREAFALGTPIAVSRIGPLPDIIKDGENGVVFEPANVASLLQVCRDTVGNRSLLGLLSRGGRRSFLKFYNEDANYKLLMEVYKGATATYMERKS